MVVLSVLLFLFLACCNKKSIETQKSTTKEETKQQAATTNEKQTEKSNTKTTEKETPSTQKTEIITTITNNGGDNEIVFDVPSENISTTNVPTTIDYIINEPISQQMQTVTEPATDTDGWVTKWY